MRVREEEEQRKDEKKETGRGVEGGRGRVRV
jgi:hypothetical protein